MIDCELDLERAARLAEQAAYAAGTHLLASRARLAETLVTRHDPAQVAATIAVEATALIRGVIQRGFAQHDFCGGTEASPWRPGRPCWLVAALDGAADYLRGSYRYAVTLALVFDGEPLLGVVYDPQRNEFFGALSGRGAVCNAAPIRCDDQPAARPARLAAALPRSNSPAMARCIAEIGRVAIGLGSVHRSVCGALDMAHLAAGRIDGLWAHDPDSHSAAAGIALLRESGACLQARDALPLLESRSIFASRPEFAPRLAALLDAPAVAAPARSALAASGHARESTRALG
ncbi:MAG: inositol monophosphatase family protein [Burkholderiaceae bacterium]